MAIKGKNLLIVEDDSVICEFYSSVLKAAGLNPTVAMTREDAIACLEKNVPHFVILDMRMDGEVSEGLKILQHIRSQESLVKVPVIVISSDSRKSTIYKALALGADDYQIKPVTAKQLLQRVRKIFIDYKESELNFINEFTGFYDANFVGLFKGNFEVSLEVSAQISAINELSCIISGPVKFENNEQVLAKAPVTREVGREKFSLRAIEASKGVEAATFSTRFSLIALDEETAQKLRVLRGPVK